LLLPTIGLRASTWIACSADIALGGLAMALWWRASPFVARRQEDDSKVGPGGDPPSAMARFVLASVVVSGALSMAYEVAWTRALSLVIGSSTYAFSLILLCVLMGLAGGAAVYARRQTRKPDQLGNLATIHLSVAATAMLGTLVLDRLPAVLLVALKELAWAPDTVFALKFGVAAIVILIPSFFMGMVFPAVVQIWSDGARAAARTAGEVYAVNTLGSILGSFVAGFVLVPWLGLQRTLTTLVIVGCLLAMSFALVGRGMAGRLVRVAVALAIAGMVLSGVVRWDLQMLTAGVFRLSRYADIVTSLGHRTGGGSDGDTRALDRRVAIARGRIPLSETVDTFDEPTEGFRLVRHVEGVTTSVGIGRSVDQALSAEGCWIRRSLFVNSKPDASLSVLFPRPEGGCRRYLTTRISGPGVRSSPAGDTETQLLSGILPLLLGRHEARSGLIIGWGSGMSIGAARTGGLQHVVAVELEREVINAARVFEPYNGIPQRDRGVTVVTEDGRNYLATRDEPFDVIISEPSNPWMAGCGNLFTEEFFRQVHGHLRKDGVFLQWLQAYEIAPANVWSILATLSSVFESVHVFSPVWTKTDLLLVARRRRGPLSWSAIERRLGRGGARRALAPVGIFDAADVLIRLRAGPRGVRAVSRGAPHNTDDNARIEFATPRDLINYKHYSSRTIFHALRRTLDLEREVIDRPASAERSLCFAELRAGRVAAASRRAARHGLGTCRRLATLLRTRYWEGTSAGGWLKGLDEAGMAKEVVARLQGHRGSAMDRAMALARDAGTTPDVWTDATLAFLLGRAGRRFAALALATASLPRASPALERGLRKLRVALLMSCRAYGRAFTEAQSLVRPQGRGELSTGKNLPSHIPGGQRDPERPK
ncbi:MAG: fused MFS/spermidine synthase, partial [Deltaproteobacteria bacterium]|nr:fused MFS/spermidine synthase [Deltaproteobacteria bacterium]